MTGPTTDALPSTARPQHVAVIGGGVVGLSTALWLRMAGHAVTLFDPNAPEDPAWTRASSFGNAATFATGAVLPVSSPGIQWQVPGMLADRDGPLTISWRDLGGLLPWLTAFLAASRPSEHSRIVAQLGALVRLAEPAQMALMAETGTEQMINRTGCLYLFSTEAKYQAARRDIDLRARESVPMRILDPDEIRAREPNLAPLYARGLLFESAWKLDSPLGYARALSDHLRTRGVTRVAAAVTGISPETDGVRLTGDPDQTAFDQVVIAAGAWSGKLAKAAGQPTALNTERGYHVLFPEDGALLNEPTCYPEHGFYMTGLAEGLRCAGTVELGGLDRPLRPRRTEVIERHARRLLPGLGAAGRTWLGFRPSMPDSLPVIGPAPGGDPRIIHAYGHGHIGLTLAALTGRMVADLVDGRAPALDIAALAPRKGWLALRGAPRG